MSAVLPLRFALPSLPSFRSATVRRVAGVAVALLLGVAIAANPGAAPKADAAVPTAVSLKALKVTASVAGVRYRTGGTSPRTGFDCSGLTRYAYGKAGRHLPRTAQQQFKAAIKIPPRSARPGDLVFFRHGKHVYHVAIYAGRGYIWHAPRPGKKVSRVKLWTKAVTFGRVR